ncbi:hypothetical protein [Alienimonas californiensis]|uniref:Uncharacterized protein n=1 Tax=Alienimonas californiensis TaxID=2527989 RepID=A0A517PFB6_9PLAN|nr:hypothetical protein [Alienimonas californiensis]QDT18073.1 hypothetical protein CA12_42120 [Alienimonas californiensis]
MPARVVPAPSSPVPAADRHKPHRIRLRGPWEWLEAGAPPAPARLPFRAEAPGVLRRLFNTPTGLDDGTTVRLTVDATPPLPSATVNDAPLAGPPDGGAEAEITPLLGAAGSRCRLDLTLSVGTLVEAAALELHLPGPPTAAQTSTQTAAS